MIRDDQDRLARFYARKPKTQKWSMAIREPTVFDVDDFEAAENARTIRQIINGQAAYYGLGAETEPTEPPAKGVTRERRRDDLLVARLRLIAARLKGE